MGEHVVATVHGDDVSIGGERSAVELLIRQISRNYEIKKQMIGEGADLTRVGEYCIGSSSGVVAASQVRRIRDRSERY